MSYQQQITKELTWLGTMSYQQQITGEWTSVGATSSLEGVNNKSPG